MAIGLADGQALTLSSFEEGEERQVSVAVISTQKKIVSVPLFVLLARAAIRYPTRDEPVPPVETTPRRCDLNIVCETPMASDKLYSPNTETARSVAVDHPSEVTEGKWLASTATYIQEHVKRRSSALDKFPHCSPRLPPDKPLEVALTAISSRRLEFDVVNKEVKVSVTSTSPQCRPESIKLSRSSIETTPGLPDSSLASSVTEGGDTKPRQLEQAVEAARYSNEHLKTETSVLKELARPASQVLEGEWVPWPAEQQPVSPVVSINETRALLHSPISPVALTLLAHSPIFLLQADSLCQLRVGPDLVPKPLDDGGPLWYLDAAASSLFSSRVEQCSPTLLKMGSPPVSKPGLVWTGDTSHFSSLELVWWERMKLPDMTTC